ncbi:MAG: DUF3592 domain-containing protein [bacterium]
MPDPIFQQPPPLPPDQIGSINKIPTASPKARFLLGLVGFIFMSIGIYFIATTLIFTATAVETTGVIIGNKITTSHSNGHTSYQYCPQTEFSVDGTQYQFTNNICSDSSYYVGAQVTVLYSPNHPENARIKAPSQWLVPLVFAIIGALAFFAAVFNKIRASY